MKYNIFYKDTKIGVLEINEIGQHRYTPDDTGIKEFKESLSIFYELLVPTDWREPIPFFENRIRDAKRFSQENDISNQTDLFRMVKIN